MKPETIEKILVLLNEDVDIKKAALMRTIENQTGNLYVDERIQEYRMAYNALEDFKDWVDEQEENK